MSKQGRLIFVCVYILTGLGLVMTYSASAIYADHVYQNPYHFLIRQSVYVLLGTFGLFAASSLPVSFWTRYARTMILLAIVFLGVVFLPGIGHSAGGAQRWIGLGLFNFQPAEFAKLAVIIYLADYLARKRKLVRNGGIGIFLPPLVLVGIVCGLILLQPDLGSCAFIFLMVAILIFFSGLQLRYAAAALAVLVPVFYFLVVRVPYRASRVTAYLNPWDDPQGSGFQIIQSFLAFGLGGVHGVGLGQGMQKLFYLPSSHNDFIFAVIAEELGLLGALFVILLYACIFFCGIKMAEDQPRDFERLLIVAVTLSIVLQALINMLVTTGLIPTKGLPLPFVSYGGTAIVFNFVAIGLLMGIDRQRAGRKGHV